MFKTPTQKHWISNIDACNPTKTPNITTKNKTWQRYGDINKICDTRPDSNTAGRASQSDFFTPIVTTCHPDNNTTPLKGKYYVWLLINVFNKNYVPVIGLNSE